MKQLEIMKQLFLIILLSIFTFGFTASEHPIYVSVAEVDYFPKKKEIQVALKIFTDDLEAAIRKEGKRLNLDTSKEIENADVYIRKYLDNYFYIKVNDKQDLTMAYKGKEYVDDVTWMYFNYTNVPKKIKTLSIKNNVIIKVHPSQLNMTHFRKDRIDVKSKNLTKKRSTMIINLK